jgi:hypothetical protein
MKLDRISVGTGDNVSAVANEILRESPFLAELEFFRTSAEAVAYKETDDPSGSMQARTKANEYGTKESLNKTPQSEAIKMHGLPVTIDKLELQTHYDIPSLMQSKMLGVARRFAKELEALVHNGTGADGKIKGLSVLASEDETFAETDGVDLSTSEGEKWFFRQLDMRIAETDPDALSMAPLMWAWMQEKARERHALTWDKNEFGAPILKYAGRPMYAIRNNGIPFTEDQGAATGKCTSFYLSKFAELDDLCYHTTVGVDVTDLEIRGSMVKQEGMIELYGTPVKYRKHAVNRIAGLYL